MRQDAIELVAEVSPGGASSWVTVRWISAIRACAIRWEPAPVDTVRLEPGARGGYGIPNFLRIMRAARGEGISLLSINSPSAVACNRRSLNVSASNSASLIASMRNNPAIGRTVAAKCLRGNG